MCIAMHIHLYIELVTVIVKEKMNTFTYDTYVSQYMCIGNALYVIEVLINSVFTPWSVTTFHSIWGNCS